MSNEDRREAPRSKSNLVLDICDTDGHLLSGTGRLLNISAKGARVESACRLDIGQSVRLRARMEKGKHLEVLGRVVWFKPRATAILYGFEFYDVTPKLLDQLQAWVQAQGGAPGL